MIQQGIAAVGDEHSQEHPDPKAEHQAQANTKNCPGQKSQNDRSYRGPGRKHRIAKVAPQDREEAPDRLKRNFERADANGSGGVDRP